jgi:hypothetical protein
MLPRCHHASHYNTPHYLVALCRRPESRFFLPAMPSPFMRFLISILLAIILVVPLSLYAAAQSARLPHHLSNHFPRKQQQLPLVAKVRAALSASARSSTGYRPEPKLRNVKRRPLTSCSAAPRHASGRTGLHRGSRPLRC